MMMVKIRKSSWHYRLLSWGEVYHSNSLCKYFWQLAWMLAKVVAGSLALSWLIISPLASLALFLDKGIVIDVEHADALVRIFSLGTMFTIAILIVGILGASVVGLLEYRDRRKSRHEKSLASVYVSSKLEKVCPLIEFEK